MPSRLWGSSVRIRRGYAATMAVAVTLSLASCSAPAGTDDSAAPGSGSDCANGPAVKESQKVKGMSPDQRETTLVTDAKAVNNGAISWYTELNDSDIITGPFEDKYPGLTVAVYRAGTDDIRQRVIEEAAAGYRGSDVIQLDYLGMDPLDKEGLLAPADTPQVSHLVPEAKYKNFIGDSLKITVPAWNPELLPADQAPKSLQDLADPRFKGKLAVEGTDVFWFAAEVTNMMDTEGMTKDQAVDVFRKIASNAAITDGHTATTEFVVAGAVLHRRKQLRPSNRRVAGQRRTDRVQAGADTRCRRCVGVRDPLRVGQSRRRDVDARLRDVHRGAAGAAGQRTHTR